jgi:hypothetical protein
MPPLFADIKLWIPQKASSYRKMRTEALEVLHATKITLPGTPLSLVLCATAPRLSNHNTGLHPVDSDHENFTCMSRWLEVQERRTSSRYYPKTASHVPAGPTKASAILVPRPKTGMPCTPSFLGWRKRKMSSQVGKAAHLAFPDSRFAIPSPAKEE